MSMGSSLSIAVLYVQSFGETWPALDVDKTEKMLQWHAGQHSHTPTPHPPPLYTAKA